METTTASCRYFIIYSRPHASADALCRLVNEVWPSELSCAGEIFAAKSAAAKAARLKSNWTFDAKRDSATAALKSFVVSRQQYSGIVLMPFQLPSTALREVVAGGGCDTRTIILRRANRTAEYSAFRSSAGADDGSSSSSSSSSHGHAWSQMSFERFQKTTDEWFARAHGPGRPTLSLSSEAIDESATLQSIATFLGVPNAPAAAQQHSSHKHKTHHSSHKHTNQQQMAEVAGAKALSVAGAKAASHIANELAGGHSAPQKASSRHGRAVLFTAVTAFAATCLAGTCFALGTAVGQRYPQGLQRSMKEWRAGAEPDSSLIGQNSIA